MRCAIASLPRGSQTQPKLTNSEVHCNQGNLPVTLDGSAWNGAVFSRCWRPTFLNTSCARMRGSLFFFGPIQLGRVRDSDAGRGPKGAERYHVVPLAPHAFHAVQRCAVLR